MRRLVGLLAFVAGTLVAVPAAPAAPPVCKLIVDPPFDSTWSYGGGYFDLIGADVAVDRKLATMSAAVRVRDLDTLLANPTQVYWHVSLRVPGTKYELVVSTHTYSTLPGFSTTSNLFAYLDGSGAGINVTEGRTVWDLGADELRMRVPLDKLRAATGITLRAGRQLTALNAVAYQFDLRRDPRLGPALGANAVADVATTKTAYRIPAPSCIKPDQPFQWPGETSR